MMIFEDWGLIDYEQALQKQLNCVEIVTSSENSMNPHPGFLIFCKHPAVVTTGRQTQPEDIFAWQGPIVEISRGGRATYHGPSQVVVYPIINLKPPRSGRGPQEIRGYLRALEKAIVLTLKEFGITAEGKTPQKIPGAAVETDETGVWIGVKKIASLGIAVKKWVSFHGAAINVHHDATAFQGLNPCGFQSSTMISVESVLQHPIDEKSFKDILKKNCIDLL